MKIDSFLEYFSENLKFEVENKSIRLVDTYYKDNADYDYGVYAKFSSIEELQNFLNERNAFALIPEFYFEEVIDFILTDELPNQYEIREEVINQISNDINTKGFFQLDYILKQYGQEAYNDFSDICKVLRGEIIPTLDIEKEPLVRE